MFTATFLYRVRLVFFAIASVLNITFGVLLRRHNVAHADICWWLFCLETFGLLYYAVVELWLNRLREGRLSVIGIIGSAVATQGVLSNSVGSAVSRILVLLAGCNLGFIFSLGLRIRSKEAKFTTVHDNEALTIRKKHDTDVGGVSASSEIQPEEALVEEKIEWEEESQSDSSSDAESFVSEPSAGCISEDLFALGLGITGLLLGIMGWLLNFSAWIKECLDKDTCSDLGPQWWTLGQSVLFFLMYIVAMSFTRTFEVLAAYSILVSIPLSVFLRVANAARSDEFFLKNQENAYETWDSVGTVIGSSLIVAAGLLLVISMGVPNFSWKTPAPEGMRTIRATLSLVGLLGVVIFGIGLHAVQKDFCDRHDPLCDWYDGLWAEISLEIVIVICGILSAFGQPGESVRAMFIALTVLPSFTYVINITRFAKLWDAHDASHSTDARWEVRFSASGLIVLFIVNYFWMFAWGWGQSECMDFRRGFMKGESGVKKTLLHTVKSFTGRRRSVQTENQTEVLEMGRINGNATL